MNIFCSIGLHNYTTTYQTGKHRYKECKWCKHRKVIRLFGKHSRKPVSVQALWAYGDAEVKSASLAHMVDAHDQKDHMDFVEVIPEHIDRGHASQSEFDHAKKFLKKVYGGKRCIVCEMRGEDYRDHGKQNHIESHHVFEWCHWNDNDMQMVEITLRAMSPFIHGLYMIPKEQVLAGDPIPSLWNHPDLIHKPFTSLDDPRNQFFLCHAHHQQSTKEQIKTGYDILGIHHVPFTVWLQYMGMPKGKLPVEHMKILSVNDSKPLDNRVE
jgi:hypothetical protein